MKKIKKLCMVIFLVLAFGFIITSPLTICYADTNKNYYTVYEGETKDKVLFLKGDDVSEGDKYLSKENNLYEIVKVDDDEKFAYTKFLQKEELPKYNVKARASTKTTSLSYGEEIYALARPYILAKPLVQAKKSNDSKVKLATKISENYGDSKKSRDIARAESKKKVGIYHTHNDESYYTPDGVDSVYGKGGIHDVGKALKENFTKLDIQAEYREDLHLPHNSGAYTRSQVTASALLNSGVDAIFDIHRDSTKRSEYLTTVGGEQMSSVRMVVGSASANYEENKNFAYAIKGYADEVYPGFIKDIYIGKGNYNQQLSTRAMLFEMGCENIEKDLAIKSTSVLAKVLDVVLYGTDGASESSLNDVDLVSDTGEKSVITGLVGASSKAGVNSNQTLYVLLGVLGVVVLTITIVLVCSKKARYKVGRFFSEMFAGIFGKKKRNN